MEIVLGSKSPRRKELLEQIGYEFIVDVIDLDEVVDNYQDSEDFVRQIAQMKGYEISKKHPDKLVICADTIVVVDEIILAKPQNQEEAKTMIEMINNRDHFVYTAVYLKYLNDEVSFVEKTVVTIDNITDKEIISYIQTDEPYDKAGGYAIQGKFGKHIKKINGDFYNVMGLPINRLYNEIKKIKKD